MILVSPGLLYYSRYIRHDIPIITIAATMAVSIIVDRISPENIKDRDKLGIALNKMSLEDPSFKVNYDQETEETVISGMGELHLEVIVDRLKNEHKVAVEVGEPAVAFRETISQLSTINVTLP